MEAHANRAVLSCSFNFYKNKAKSAQKSEQSDAERRWTTQELLHYKLIWFNMFSLHKQVDIGARLLIALQPLPAAQKYSSRY